VGRAGLEPATKVCHPIGNKHLAVPLDQELKFRKALLKLGYVVPGQPMT
jgi:urease accessory protein UreE